MGTTVGPGTVPDVRQLSQFLTDFGHEVMTPLARILLASEMLADNTQGNLTESQVHSLQTLIQATDQIQILVKRVVLLTRLATRQLELHHGPFPLEMLIRELADAHPGVTITRVPPLPTNFTSDRLWLFELLELMVEVGTRLDPAPELRVASSPADGLSFLVQAKGRLSDEQLTRAFDPFTAGLKIACRSGQAGLELALVDRLNCALDGRLEISNHAGGKVDLEARFPLLPA